MPIARSIVFPGRGRWLSSPGLQRSSTSSPSTKSRLKTKAPSIRRHFDAHGGNAGQGYMHYLMESGYDEGEEQVYSAEEQRFVRKVLEMIPGGALVINQPHDGSAFAYGLDGLNTYFRHIDTEGTTEQSRTIRDHLSDIATDSTVREAVRNSGAQYVLLLDQGAALRRGQMAHPNWRRLRDGMGGLSKPHR